MTLFVIADIVLIIATLLELNYPEGSQLYLLTLFRNVLTFALPLAAVIFIGLAFFPRFSISLFRSGSGTRIGYNQNSLLSPDDVSRLALSEEPVFHVRFTNGNTPNLSSLYWRGTILWTSRGMKWTREGIPAKARHEDQISTTLPYNVLLEPRFGATLFALEGSQHLEITAPIIEDAAELPGGIFSIETVTREATLYNNATLLGQGTIVPRKEDIAAGNEAYLKLTNVPSSKDPRLINLVASLHEFSTNSERVAKLTDWFKEQNFTYSLQTPDKKAKDLADFLYHVKTGYCEQYAAAFASTLRMAGVPTRIILGFRGGESNEFDGSITVRDDDAHAWVEYWDERQNVWVHTDPTLAVEEFPDRNGKYNAWVQRIRHLWEASSNQLRLLRISVNLYVSVWTEEAKAELRIWRVLLLKSLLVVFSFALLVLVVVRARRDWKNTRRTFLARFYRDIVLRRDPATFYHQYCEYLASKGIARKPQEGPVDYLTRCSEVWPEAKLSLVDFTDAYINARYTKIPNSNSNLKRKLRRVKYSLNRIVAIRSTKL